MVSGFQRLPSFDDNVWEQVPRLLQRLRILEFTLDHEAPYFDNMRRRTSRKDSDLNGVVDVRYTGGARMLLLLEVGRQRWRLKVSLPMLQCASTHSEHLGIVVAQVNFAVAWLDSSYTAQVNRDLGTLAGHA